jgi:hypothetical protein
VSGVYRNPSPQIRETERGSSIASVDRSKKAEQGVVLGYSQQLSVGERPTTRCKIPREHPDLAYEWF